LISEFLDQYFEISNLNKKQEVIEEQIEEIEEETLKEEWEEEETEKEEEFEEKEEEPNLLDLPRFSPSFSAFFTAVKACGRFIDISCLFHPIVCFHRVAGRAFYFCG